MNKMLGVFMGLLLLGCKNFETQKVSSDYLVQEELNQINWNEVDHYPAFSSCQHCTDLQEQKRCFESKLSIWVYEKLMEHQVSVKDSLNEKMLVFFKISKTGDIQVDSLQQSDLLVSEIPHLEEWLRHSLEDLPQVYPAQKRGIPVQTAFQLPVQITSE